jgi:nitrogenase molybdenum-iron protein NifN
MTTRYRLKDLKTVPSAAATQNACKLCAPLGAAMVFKGIERTVPLLHGSQGCSTYIRRYIISHFKEPMDIACSNFGEQTAIFGGGANLKLALNNIIAQYSPDMVGIATTCLAETIGDDVAMFIKEYKDLHHGETLPPLVHVSTPSYQGTHMQGFHAAVRAVIGGLAHQMRENQETKHTLNLFPGMVSPEDLRHLKDIISDFGLSAMVLPDYSETLDGGLWESYQRVPAGGTPVSAIAAAGSALASIEFGAVLAQAKETAGTLLHEKFGIPCHRLGLPIGIRQTDRFMQALGSISGKPIPPRYVEQRGRLVDALVDGHKYVNTFRAAVYGEADLVAGMAGFLAEIGITPVICASGDGNGQLKIALQHALEPKCFSQIHVMEKVDFVDIENAVAEARPDLIIGHSKGYSLARRIGIPLVRIGFPIHDRIGGSRMLHVGYGGAQALFDGIANILIAARQDAAVGYTYI